MRRATSRFQMNSTSTAPTVAPMRPAPWSEPVPTDGLADEGCDERAGDPESGRQNEAVRAIRTGREETPDDPRDEADHDDPDNVRHEDLPLCLCGCTVWVSTLQP